MEPVISQKPGRILSIDVMRGIIMILLAAESCSVYESLKKLEIGGAFGTALNQFFHHPWHGLHFWDLLQPSFMLIAGTGMYISYYHKREKGINWEQNFKHIAIRSVKLFLLGAGLLVLLAGVIAFGVLVAKLVVVQMR